MMMNATDMDMTTTPKQGWSTGKKIGCGCAIVALLAIVCCGSAVWWAYSTMFKPFLDKGYELKMDDKVVVSETLEASTLYFAESVIIEEGANESIAFWVQTAEIHGIVEGDVDFYGETITIHEDAVIKGNLSVFGQRAIINGVVEGEITGEYQEIIEGQTDNGTGNGESATDAPSDTGDANGNAGEPDTE